MKVEPKPVSMPLKESLFDLSKDFLLITNTKGVIKEFNQSFLDFFGYSAGELKGKKLADLVHKDDVLPAKMLFLAHEEEHDAVEQMLRFNTRKESFQPVNVIVKHRTSKELLIQLVDMLPIQRNESESIVNEHVLFLILDLVPYPVFVKNSKSEYILLNQAQANLFGLKLSEMLGKSDHELIQNEQELDMVRESDKQVLELLQKVTIPEQNFTTPNGTRYVLQTTKVPFINAVTGERNILGVSIDYTDRKSAEDELVKTNFELDSFVYRSSHDLKAPLRSVLGLVSLMRMDKSEENLTDCVERMEKTINRLDLFISDLTNYSRNARLEIQKQDIDLEGLIYNTLDNLKYLDPLKKISVDLKIDKRASFFSDKHRIEVVLQNILSNSIKYQKSSSSKPFIKVIGRITDHSAQIEIRDNGIGIKKEYQNGIFNMFYRATERSEGSGLGLYIVKQAVDKLQGNVTFESEEDKGTTFKITFRNLKEST
jgi:PAS domain S-box-containing protein